MAFFSLQFPFSFTRSYIGSICNLGPTLARLTKGSQRKPPLPAPSLRDAMWEGTRSLFWLLDEGQGKLSRWELKVFDEQS